jgi:hypothetical protein
MTLDDATGCQQAGRVRKTFKQVTTLPAQAVYLTEARACCRHG